MCVYKGWIRIEHECQCKYAEPKWHAQHEQLPLSDCHAGLPEHAQLLPSLHTLGWHTQQSFISPPLNPLPKK